MQILRTDWRRFCALAILLFMCILAVAADTTANVAGTWTVDVKSGNRTVTQTVVLQQDGGKIAGTFKGPRQSGTVDGKVEGNAITFHVTAALPIDYSGTVDGDTMTGKLTGRGQTGDWTATRAKQE